MPERERDEWEKNLYSPTMVRTTRATYKKEIHYRHRTTNQSRNNHQNRIEYKRKNTIPSLGIGTRSNKSNNTIRISNRTWKNWNRQKNLKYRTDITCRKETNITHEIFFWALQSNTETPEDHWKKLIKLEKECDFPDFITELLISKFITPVTDRMLRDKLLKEEDLDVWKIFEQIQQNTYDRKNKKNAIPDALISIWQKKNRRRSYTQNNLYRKTRNKTERKTKRTKLQILQRTKLELQTQMPSPRIDMPMVGGCLFFC